MLGMVKRAAFNAIAMNREAFLVRGLHKGAEFVSAAYNNQGSEFEVNGERRILAALASADIRTVFDVGANVGHWTTAALELWPQAQVHAFEIAPQTAEVCRQALRRHPAADRAQLHEFGLSDAAGEIPMFYFPGNDQLTCSGARHTQLESVAFMGRVETVDGFCEARGITRIDHLKIDVEGNEYRVLHGAARMLAADAIGSIQFEYGAFSTDTRFLLKDYYELLQERYVIGKIYPKYVKFSEYGWQMEDFKFCNYLAVHRGRAAMLDALKPR